MRKIPEYKGKLRKNLIYVPEIIESCTGIRVFGQLLKSFIYSTDLAIIRNTNANAVIAVYPFTAQPIISNAIIAAAGRPVFCGVGGGITTGERSVKLASDAEFHGAFGVVLNKPVTNDVIKRIKAKMDIPVTLTVVSLKDEIKKRIASGVDIFNVSGAEKTADIVRMIRDIDGAIPIIATGGKNEGTIQSVIEAGANAVSHSPPTTAELFKEIMAKYRSE